MIAKLTVVAAALAAAALALVVPDPYRPAALSAMAMLVFGVYVLRHRAALRGLFKRLAQSSTRTMRAIGGVRSEVDKLVAVQRQQSKQLRELTDAVDEIRKVATEATAVNGVAASAILDRLDGLDSTGTGTGASGHAVRPPRILAHHDPRGLWPGYEAIRVPDVRTFVDPRTVARGGLRRYSDWFAGGKADATALAKAVEAAEWLAAQQDERGGWPVPFEFTVHDSATLAPGWYSATAQGMAGDLLAKLAVVTSDARYADAALRGLEVLSLPVGDGGVKRLYRNELEWWEEYPTRDLPTFVLSGFLCALIGVYDTAVLLDSARAMDRYSIGLETLIDMVGLFDLGHRSAYDLWHISNPGAPPSIARWDCHNLHVTLISAIKSVSDGRLAEVGRRWAGYSRGVSARDDWCGYW